MMRFFQNLMQNSCCKKSDINEARAKFAAAENASTSDEKKKLIADGKDFLESAHEKIKEAHKILKEGIKNMREKVKRNTKGKQNPLPVQNNRIN